MIGSYCQFQLFVDENFRAVWRELVVFGDSCLIICITIILTLTEANLEESGLALLYLHSPDPEEEFHWEGFSFHYYFFFDRPVEVTGKWHSPNFRVSELIDSCICIYLNQQ